MHRIQKMDWRNINLNLLVVFQALLEHRGVTRAGQALGMSQPAMSASLAQLRDLFQDPLFVRSGTEMKPTPRALELDLPVRRVLESIQTDVLQRAEFDPLRTDRCFTIVTPDIGEVIFLPRLIARLAQDAPGATVRAISRPPVATAAALESGEADLAIGMFPDLQKAGFYQQKLTDVPVVCLVRIGHPQIQDHLTMEQFVAAAHIAVRPDGRGHDVSLFPGQVPPRIAVEVSHFMSVLPILESSDLVASMPQDVARVCARYADVRILPLPFSPPTLIPVHQFWHERFHKDPAHHWLRSVVKRISAD